MKLNIPLSSPNGAGVITCLHEQGTKNSPETLHRNCHCSINGEGTRPVSSGANIRVLGRAQTCVEFPAFIYTARGKYCYSKVGLNIANGRSRWEMRSSGLLCSEQWSFLADVPGQLVGPIFWGQEGTDRLSRNVGTKLPIVCAITQKSAVLVN